MVCGFNLIYFLKKKILLQMISYSLCLWIYIKKKKNIYLNILTFD
jgi:hypothetical protein